MFRRLMLACTLALAPTAARAQPELPVLRANSKIIDVRDGERLRKGKWMVDPSTPLDVYAVQRSAGPKTVTFITDVESRSFDVAPGGTCDFIILLNGTERCRTQISMTATSARRAEGTPPGPVTIPLAIVKGKPHIQGQIDDSQMLDLLFDTGADTTVVYPSGMRKGVTLAFDGSGLNAGTGGAVQRQTSSDNRLAVAGLRWDHESVTFIEKQTDDSDGIVGYNVFEDKVVELDYDRMVMVIHDTLPARAASYSKVAMPYFGSLTAVDGALVSGDTRATGPMILDTGGTGALVINRALADQHGLRSGLKVLGSSTSGGVGPAKIANDVLLVPALEVAGHTLPNVPVNVPHADDQSLLAAVATEEPRGLLCMDVLGRFNTFFDYQTNNAYFKPNGRFVGPFKYRTASIPAGAVAGIAAASVLVFLFVALKIHRARERVKAGPL